MEFIKFILKKIIIVEIMLIILSFACSFFGVSIGIVDLIINTGLTYLTPLAVISLVLYIIFSLLTSKIIETVIGVILGGIILYYLFVYLI